MRACAGVQSSESKRKAGAWRRAEGSGHGIGGGKTGRPRHVPAANSAGAVSSSANSGMSARRPATAAKPKSAAPPEPDELKWRLEEREARLGCAADKLER